MVIFSEGWWEQDASERDENNHELSADTKADARTIISKLGVGHLLYCIHSESCLT